MNIAAVQETLTQGIELATQLSQPDVLECKEAREALFDQIFAKYDTAISLLNSTGLKRGADQLETFHQSPGGRAKRVSKDQGFQNDVSKKRKTKAGWNEEVRVSSGAGPEGLRNDGHSWRKYGQKDILGAKFPRAYYRCTHQKTQGCQAVKQVQKTDESLYQITYKGHHTCIQSSNSSSRKKFFDHNSPSSSSSVNHKDNLTTSPVGLLDSFCNIQEGIKVETDQAMSSKDEIFGSLCCDPWGQVESADGFSPAFLSPTTSDSDYFPFEWQMGSYGYDSVLQNSDSEFTADIISTPTSAIESPFSYLDFSVEAGDFDSTIFLHEALR